ncbi:MAG: hypothetical protein RIC12_00790 [Pirellulales bacterium]
MKSRSVTLRETRDQSGVRKLGASLAADGTLTLEGWDLGDGVERIFGPGNREYEWRWTIQPQEVPKLVIALASGDDVLAVLKHRFSDEAAGGLKRFLDEEGIPYKTWSRVGE